MILADASAAHPALSRLGLYRVQAPFARQFAVAPVALSRGWFHLTC
jgi:hypothetical protein